MRIDGPFIFEAGDWGGGTASFVGGTLFYNNDAIRRRFVVSEHEGEIVITREQKYLSGDWHESHRLILRGDDLRIAADGSWTGTITRIDYGNARPDDNVRSWGSLLNADIDAGLIDNWLQNAMNGSTIAVDRLVVFLLAVPNGIQGDAERNIIRIGEDFPANMTVFNGGGGDDFLALDGPYRRGWMFDGQSGRDTFSMEYNYVRILIDATTGLIRDARDLPLFTVHNIEDWSIREGNVLFKGTAGADKVFAYEDGRDTLYGGAGNDTLTALSGSDIIFGGAGNDVIMDLAGNDFLYGGAGFDVLDFDRPDFFYNGFSPMWVSLLSGTAYLEPERRYGIAGTKTIDGFEAVRGGASDDRLLGDRHDNTFWGRSGDDYLLGREGNDRLFGERGDDTLIGGGGNDTLIGGLGSNVLAGMYSDDTFVFNNKRGQNTLTDFDMSDVLHFTPLSGLRTKADVLAAAKIMGDDVQIILEDGGWILLQDFTLSELRQASLLFI